MLMGATLRPLDTVQKLKGSSEQETTPYGLVSLQIPSLPTYNESLVTNYNQDMPLEQTRN